jgi:hypothetical protein
MNRLILILSLLLCQPAIAEVTIRPIETQFIAAVGSATDTHGTNAQTWGLWTKDPGPRGVWLKMFPALSMAGMAPAGWRFDAQDWWLEEHGLIMEAPAFGLPAGQYVVTGGREVTSTLTIGAPDANGAQTWDLSDGATLEQVTHLGCRAARYSPANGQACSPANASTNGFPLSPGDSMPAVTDCTKKDYNVLFVVGMVEGSS